MMYIPYMNFKGGHNITKLITMPHVFKFLIKGVSSLQLI